MLTRFHHSTHQHQGHHCRHKESENCKKLLDFDHVNSKSVYSVLDLKKDIITHRQIYMHNLHTCEVSYVSIIWHTLLMKEGTIANAMWYMYV